ncbi:pili assembly chaperone [Salmonella enterica]|nr:pili assembly chaperone [Salmonella enterica]EEX1006488.1 pili assembly chaperone [Escherichia coli]
MELTLSQNVKNENSRTERFIQSKAAKVILFFILAVAVCGLSYAGSDDGALGDIWSYMSESMTGAPGKILAAAMLFSSLYFSIIKPNPGMALVSVFMMLVMANGEKIISTFMDAGVAL